MKVLPLLLLITLSEATIGVFVKLTDGRIPIQTLNFYALSAAALMPLPGMPGATGQPLAFPRRNPAFACDSTGMTLEDSQ